MQKNPLLDATKYSVTSKHNAHAKLTDAQVQALQHLVSRQGDLAALDPAVRTELAGLQARTATDPSIAGAAAIVDFSIRAVSIHKTWSFFKNMKTTPDFDPETLPRVNLNLGDIVGRG